MDNAIYIYLIPPKWLENMNLSINPINAWENNSSNACFLMIEPD